MKLAYHSLSFGADPEFFFEKNGEVIGAEKVLPKEGVSNIERYYTGKVVDGLQEIGERPIGDPLIIIDGVQAEFNVVPNHCRQTFSTNLSICFRKIAQEIHGKGITASFAQTVEVDKEEMQSLSKDAQQFGCAPSKNAYGLTKVAVKDASKYYSRSAGGHIHLGGMGNTDTINVLKNADLVVPILDIIVGNTCVLLDLDKGNVERRKNYGRAGEYRLPKHGLEYRTLSNFWLRSYQTMSFVLALSRFAVCIALDPAATEKLMSLVNMEDTQNAINNNDTELAWANFNKIKAFVKSITATDSGTGNWWPLQGVRMEQFEFFAQKGLDYWFKEDIMKHWVNHSYRDRFGWENFLTFVVAKKMPISKTLKEEIVARSRRLVSSVIGTV